MFALTASTRMMRCLCIVVALLAVMVGGEIRAASMVSISSDGGNSTEGLGSFTGSISYAADNAFSTSGLLTISLTNTSAAANGGYITGLLFNIGGTDPNAAAAYQPSAGDAFSNCTGNGLSGQPFGNPFDAGAALGGSFLGGGSPLAGIGVGQTGSFSFLVSALDAGSLNASDFLNGGPFDFNFIVRFRGFEDGGSDKVPAMLTTPNVVPLPMPLALGAVGLIAAMVGSYRLRRKSAGT
jgi:hypothetical protein